MEFSLGQINNENFAINTNELAERLLIIGGYEEDKDSDYNLLLDLIDDFQEKGFAVWIFSGAPNSQKTDFLEIFKKENEKHDLGEKRSWIALHEHELKSKDQTKEASDLHDCFNEIKSNGSNLIARINEHMLDGLSMFIHQKVSLGKQGLNSESERPTVVVMIGTNRYPNEALMSLSTYSKAINMHMVAHIDSYLGLYESMLVNDSWVMSSMIESCKTKIIFQQNDQEENIAVSRLFNMPVKVRKRIFHGDKEVCFLQQIQENECLLVVDSEIKAFKARGLNSKNRLKKSANFKN